MPVEEAHCERSHEPVGHHQWFAAAPGTKNLFESLGMVESLGLGPLAANEGLSSL